MRRIWLIGVGLAGLLASLAVNWPGHFPPDALWQLAQGRGGVFNDWHPPVMAWLLGVADRAAPGAAPFIVLQGALFFAGLVGLAAAAGPPRPIGLAALGVVAALPIVLVYQGFVVKDVLFADAALAGFAALAWAGRLWANRSARLALVSAALVLLTLAALTRQNGFVAPLCGAFAVAAMAWADAPRRMVRAALCGLGFLAAAGILGGAASYALALHSDGEPQNLNQLKRLQVYDLAGALHADPSLDLSILHAQAPELEQFVRQEAAPNYRSAGADNLELLPDGDEWLIPPGDAASRQWNALVTKHPALYLRVRAAVFATTLLAPRAQACPVVFVGVDGSNPALLKGAGLRPRFDAKDRWAMRYATAFEGGPTLSHLSYLVLAVAMLGLAMRDLIAGGASRPDLIAVAAMISAALAFTASFFVISNACDYRYLYFLDVGALAALVHRAQPSRFL